MKAERFEDLIIWQRSREMTISVYKAFKISKDFSFKNQIQRAAVSVMNNIAEGFERKSNKEFKQFLYIAKGSAGEVRNMLYIANDLNYIDEDNFNDLYNNILFISRTIANLIKKL
jgi:four helix bundle protein